MASTIPPVLVELQLETANIKAQMQQLNEKFTDFGATVSKQTSFLSNFKSAAVGVFAGNVMTQGLQMLKSGLAGAIKDAQDYEKVTAQLKAGLISTGNVAGLSVAGLKSYANQLESLSAVDENLILQSQAVFQTFTQVRNSVGEGNDIFNQASLAALDLATKMGGDLQGATVQLGKALNDPIKGITALTRVGVVFTQSQKDQIKAMTQAGDVIGAQKIILAEMKTEFGGAAAAAGDTFAGAIFRAKDKVADFTRDLITNLQPILLKIGKTIGDLYNTFLKPLIDIISKNKEAVLLFVGVLGTAIAVFKLYKIAVAAGVAINELYVVATALMRGAKLADIAATEGQTGAMVLLNAVMNANPIAKVVVVVAALAAGFVVAWNHSETFRKVVVAVAKAGVIAIGYLIEFIGKLATAVIKVATGPLTLLLKGLALLKVPGAKAALDGITGAIDTVGTFFDKTAKSVKGYADNLDSLANKKIKLPGIGGAKDTAAGVTPAVAPEFTGVNKEAVAAAKKNADEITKTMVKVAAVYDDINKAMADGAKKEADAAKNRDEDITKARLKNAEIVAQANQKFNDAKAAANKKYNETVEKEDLKLLEATADAYKKNKERVDTINKDYAKRTVDLEEKLQSTLTDLRSKAATKSSDLIAKALDKQESIVKSSVDRLRSAFASKTSVSLVESFTGGKSISDVLTDLKNKLSAAKNLADNAALLQGQGFSQTFIEQVVAAGPEVGNSLAESILAASPDSIKELQATFNAMEQTSNYGLDALAKSMNLGGKLATKELTDAYAQVAIDLQESLKEVSSELTKALAQANADYGVAMVEAGALRDEKLSESAKTLLEALDAANKNYTDAIADAKKTLTESIADAQATLDEALKDAAQSLADNLLEIQKSYNDAMAQIAADTEARIETLRSKLMELAQTLSSLGAAQQAASVMQNAPTYTPTVLPPPTYQGSSVTNQSPNNVGNGQYGMQITQNISYPQASTSEISSATLAAIKFGTSGGYSFTGSQGSM